VGRDNWPRGGYADESADFADRLLLEDIGNDPLEALRALDERLFQAFDRERSEHEFRIAVMPPVVAITAFAGWVANPWAFMLAALVRLC